MLPASATDDAELLSRAQDGDQRAFAALMDRHRRILWGVSLRILGDASDAEDAVQDTMIAAWRHIGGFRADSRFSTWLYRIATNAALAILRKRTETDELPLELPEASGSSFSDRVGDHDAIARALMTLPEAFRVALVLREYGDFTYAEIAAQQDIVVATVKTRINRARTMMRWALQSDR